MDVTTEFVVPETVTPGEEIRVTVEATDELGEVSEPLEIAVPVLADDDGT